MAYKRSALDDSLSNWFTNDFGHALLREIELEQGSIRSLRPFVLPINYPICAIAGRNGSGKSTILALACCAFHAGNDENSLVQRTPPYYRFSDFFIQSEGEVPPEGIRIGYRIAYDEWKPTEKMPKGKGIGYQARIKPKGGKWNDYDTRVDRPVVFFGIDRVVPHAEKSVSKSYRRRFSQVQRAGWENLVQEQVGRILGIPYEDFEYRRHSKYRLPFVRKSGSAYSGFNMGAGENALFEMFSVMHAAPNGTLVVVDELELGLHEEAQKRLIAQLKQLCKEKHLQVICTTHSPTVLRCLPPDARNFVECVGAKTLVTPGISPAYATGKLAGENSGELHIYVEDSVANRLVTSCLDLTLRSRVTLIPIGSSGAVVDQLTSRRREKSGRAIALLDGDQRQHHVTHRQRFLRNLGRISSEEIERTWFDRHVAYLPGDTWPERWIMESLSALELAGLADLLNTDVDCLRAAVDEGQTSAKHHEFYELGAALHLSEERVAAACSEYVVKNCPEAFTKLRQLITDRLRLQD